jgi:chemotaxis protein CheD
MSISDLYNEALAPNLYYDDHFDIDAVNILLGEYYAAVRSMTIVTVLGSSCIATCIRDRISGIGGMNHFMLPSFGDFGKPINTLTRCGSYSMAVFINQLLKIGAQRKNLEAQIFVSGNLMKGDIADKVDERNALFVRSYLKMQQIPIVTEYFFDIYPRKIYFFPDQGKVMVKKLTRLYTTPSSNANRNTVSVCATKKLPVAAGWG